MIRKFFFGIQFWSFVVPMTAYAVLAEFWGHPLGWKLVPLVTVSLVAAVLVAVHHAEIVALRVGEPFGTLILALAITVIEVTLIVSLMISGGAVTTALARDTVFATVMITCNGAVGLCLLLGALRHRVLAFQVDGVNPALSVLATLTTLTLVLPTYTTSTSGPTFSNLQLAFAGVVSLTLYSAFVFIQTVRHHDDFLPVVAAFEAEYADRPSIFMAVMSFVFLFFSLLAVVGLAKMLAPTIEDAVKAASAPHAVVGIIIALLVLLPETWAAVRAALRNRMQTSFNLVLGSALATIGLTIPAVAVTSIFLQLPLELGLPPKETTLLAITLLISAITLTRGQSTVLQGAVHLILFAVFLFLAIFP